ncbi:MAG: MBL fold metallo-hydrolase [Clostridia bacterium]|nr:MBL fold metallo-hydrolase [Clostridia bacterium]
MQITWYGHSCFLLTAPGAPRVLTDPCDPETGYALHDIEAEIVTVSHGHHDHDCVDVVAGSPTIVRLAGERRFGDLSITGIPTWHDDVRGKARGGNLLFLIEMGGLRLLHLGDLGHVLGEDQVRAVGAVDVLFTPIGGKYTIDAAAARQVADALRPRVLIPMHYKTEALSFAIDGLEPFLCASNDLSIHRLNEASCSIEPDALGEDRVLILDYKKI